MPYHHKFLNSKRRCINCAIPAKNKTCLWQAKTIFYSCCLCKNNPNIQQNPKHVSPKIRNRGCVMKNFKAKSFKDGKKISDNIEKTVKHLLTLFITNAFANLHKHVGTVTRSLCCP